VDPLPPTNETVVLVVRVVRGLLLVRWLTNSIPTNLSPGLDPTPQQPQGYADISTATTTPVTTIYGWDNNQSFLLLLLPGLVVVREYS
jgi:hypothetical protein